MKALVTLGETSNRAHTLTTLTHLHLSLSALRGTEKKIRGSFLSSTLVQPKVPSMVSSPVLRTQILLLYANEKLFDASAPSKKIQMNQAAQSL